MIPESLKQSTPWALRDWVRGLPLEKRQRSEQTLRNLPRITGTSGAFLLITGLCAWPADHWLFTASLLTALIAALVTLINQCRHAWERHHDHDGASAWRLNTENDDAHKLAKLGAQSARLIFPASSAWLTYHLDQHTETIAPIAKGLLMTEPLVRAMPLLLLTLLLGHTVQAIHALCAGGQKRQREKQKRPERLTGLVPTL